MTEVGAEVALAGAGKPEAATAVAEPLPAVASTTMSKGGPKM